ncbi:phosphomannomutase/phosphoglucomutase [Asaia sp. HN010]|uniref:phosphomannomutase/phosphoglucomutase n=1 Tax=Asaia sp. HN010 TaxID=3081233 RepID=UPI0030162723
MDTPFRHEFHPSILREYDIRGMVGKTLFENDAQALGVVFASVLREQGRDHVVVGHDGRDSSPGLEQALVGGLVSGGMNVKRLGCCPTPELYFASFREKAAGAIMVTGSHNPIGYNGFKIVLGNQPFFGEALLRLAQALRGGVQLGVQSGQARWCDYDGRYEAALAEGLRHRARKLRVVWDNSHSSAAYALSRLLPRLPGEHIVLNGTVDGLFPAHHPDPTLPENMVQLQHAVCVAAADLGVAFDGDADRLGVVNESGALIPADRLSLIFAQSILQERPGAMILGDVKMSQVFFDGVVAAGGRVAMCPSGHSEVKSAMRETGAAFAGEMSGHFFFADHWPGFDDGLYAAIRLIDLLAGQSQTLSKLCEALPHLVSTPEIRFECDDDIKFAVIDRIVARCRAAGDDLVLTDGVRVKAAHGWWLLRASNTQPALVARVEGSNHATCHDMLAHVASLLQDEGVVFPVIEGFPPNPGETGP